MNLRATSAPHPPAPSQRPFISQPVPSHLWGPSGCRRQLICVTERLSAHGCPAWASLEYAVISKIPELIRIASSGRLRRNSRNTRETPGRCRFAFRPPRWYPLYPKTKQPEFLWTRGEAPGFIRPFGENHSVASLNRRIPRTVPGTDTWPTACVAEAASSEFDAPGSHEPRSSNGWFIG